MALFNKKDSRREVKLTCSAWKLMLSTSDGHYTIFLGYMNTQFFIDYMLYSFSREILFGFQMVWQNGSHLSGFQMVGLLDFRSHSKSGPFATQPLFDHSKIQTSPDFRSPLSLLSNYQQNNHVLVLCDYSKSVPK